MAGVPAAVNACASAQLPYAGKVVVKRGHQSEVAVTWVETLDIYIMNPGNPTPDAAATRAKDLFIKLGGISTEVDMGKVFTDIGNAVIGNHQGLSQTFHDMMTAVFRAFMAAMIFLMMFIIGTMRVVMTATIIVGLPMILAIRLIPWIRFMASW